MEPPPGVAARSSGCGVGGNVEMDEFTALAARAKQAAQTRRRILAAAARLFAENGYTATSVAEIAAEAGVAIRTVYLDFPKKAHLLDEAVGIALGGDDSAVMVRDRDWFRQPSTRGGPELPAHFARFTAALHERSAALLEAVEAAAATDPDVAQRGDQGRQNRRADMQRVAAAIAARSGADLDHATDLLYTLGSSAVYGLLVFQCGWTSEQYERWLVTTLEAALLP